MRSSAWQRSERPPNAVHSARSRSSASSPASSGASVPGSGSSSVSVGTTRADDAQRAQAFAARGRGEPRAHALGVLQPVEVLDQPQPGGLDHVGGVGPLEPVRAGDRPDEPVEPLHEPVPGRLIARRGGPHELPDIRHGRLLSHRRTRRERTRPGAGSATLRMFGLCGHLAQPERAEGALIHARCIAAAARRALSGYEPSHSCIRPRARSTPAWPPRCTPPTARVLDRHLRLAADVTGLPVRRLCLEGTAEQLARPDVGAARAVRAAARADRDGARGGARAGAGGRPAASASIAAAVAAGALSPDDAMRLVVAAQPRARRGQGERRPGRGLRRAAPAGRRRSSGARRAMPLAASAFGGLVSDPEAIRAALAAPAGAAVGWPACLHALQAGRGERAAGARAAGGLPAPPAWSTPICPRRPPDRAPTSRPLTPAAA